MLPRVKTTFSDSLLQPAIPVYAPNGVDVNITGDKVVKVVTQPGSTTIVTSDPEQPLVVRDPELIALVRSLRARTQLNFRAYVDLVAYDYLRFSNYINEARFTHLINHANDDIYATLHRNGFIDVNRHFLTDLKLTLSASWTGWKASAGADYTEIKPVPVTYTINGRNSDFIELSLFCKAGSFLSDSCSTAAASFIRNSADLSYSRNTAALCYSFETI